MVVRFVLQKVMQQAKSGTWPHNFAQSKMVSKINAILWNIILNNSCFDENATTN